MNTISNIVASAVIAVLVVSTAFVWQIRPEIRDAVESIPAGAPTPDIPGYFNVHGVFTQGAGCTASSTTAAGGTIQYADFDDETCIDFTVNQADVTLTLTATSSGPYPLEQGQWRTLWIRNASTTATADIFIAAGTGITIKMASTSLANGVGTTTIFGDTDGDNTARIDFFKKSDTDVNAYITKFAD